MKILNLACENSLTVLLNTSSSWNRSRLLTAQKSHTATWSEAFPIASIGNLMSSELQSPCERVPNFLKACNASVISLLIGWGFIFMAFPALRIRAASLGIQPSTPSSKCHWLALVCPLFWGPLARRDRRHDLMVSLWTLGTQGQEPYMGRDSCGYPELSSSELQKWRANFPVASAGAPLFWKK